MNAREGVEKRGPAYAINGIVNWCNRYGEQYGWLFPKGERVWEKG